VVVEGGGVGGGAEGGGVGVGGLGRGPRVGEAGFLQRAYSRTSAVWCV